MKIFKNCAIVFLFLFCFSSYVQAATPTANWIEIVSDKNQSVYLDKNSISKDKNGIISAWSRSYPTADLLKTLRKSSSLLSDILYFDRLCYVNSESNGYFTIMKMNIYNSKNSLVKEDKIQRTHPYTPLTFDGILMDKIIELESNTAK